VILQGLSRSLVEFAGYCVELGLAVYREVGAFWEVLAQKTIGVLVGAALPGASRVTEVHRDAGGYGKEVSAASAERQKAVLAEHIKAADVVITTAAVPGKKAPILVEEEAVKGMRHGSVIVDLAAETGGNCELTEVGKTVIKH